MTSGVAMATIDVDRLVAGNDVGSKGLRAPLLVWLVGKDVKETAKLLRDTLVTKDSDKQVFERFNVWCMLELVGMIGDSKIFKMSPEKDSDDCWRDDMDGLASVNKENEFLHYLFNRLQTPNGFNPGDVVVLFGNLLLNRLPRFQSHFRVKLLCVDKSDTTNLALQLKTQVDTLNPISGAGLTKWMEDVITDHGKHVGNCSGSSSDLFNDPLFSLSIQSANLITQKLRNVTWKTDKDVIEASMCKIAALRCGKVARDDDSESDGSVDEAGNSRSKRPAKKLKSTLNSNVLKPWLVQKLDTIKKAKLSWVDLKAAIKEHFNQAVPNNMLHDCGLFEDKSHSLQLVKNQDGARMGWKV